MDSAKRELQHNIDVCAETAREILTAPGRSVCVMVFVFDGEDAIGRITPMSGPREHALALAASVEMSAKRLWDQIAEQDARSKQAD